MSDFDELRRRWEELPTLDPEIAFYLQNQPLIERWAALGARARPVVDSFYEHLTAVLRADAPAEVFLERQEQWSMLLWRHANWPHACGIGVCWQPGKLGSCFSGLRLQPGDPAIEKVLAHPDAQGALSSEFWTVWREEKPPEPLDLEAFCNATVAQVHRHWESFSAIL